MNRLMYSIDVLCTCPGLHAQPTLRVDLLSSSGEEKQAEIVPPDRVIWDREATRVTLSVPDGGYWNMVYDTPGRWIRGSLLPLPAGPRGWWHTLHDCDMASPGIRPLRIGVIDESLPKQTDVSPLHHVRNLGGEAWNQPDGDARAYISMGWEHGFIVCSLLAARPVAHSPTGFVGMAPESEVFFMSAGSDAGPTLDSGRVVKAIFSLIDDYRCDLITMSAGEVATPLEQIRDAFEYANDSGALCFVAAGNDGGKPGYPARYSECLAVGAVGRRGWAPERTVECAHEASSPLVDGDLFVWHSSAFGPYVDFLGAGVGICYTLPNGQALAVSGTSYATPLVTGAAARLLGGDATYRSLPRNAGRVTYALNLLRKVAQNPFPQTCSVGIIGVK